MNHLGYTWKFLNKNEGQETLQYLRSYEGNQYVRLHIPGNPRNVLLSIQSF